MEKENTEFCKCTQHVKGVYTENDDFGEWDCCMECEKPIEDSFEFFNDSVQY